MSGVVLAFYLATRQDFELNVVRVVRVLQAVIKRLKKAGGAPFVLFSTVAAYNGMSFHASIATARAAMESLAGEYASSGIRVNALAPSLTDMPLAAALLNTPEKQEAGAKRHPLQRVGQPQDLAATAVFLLSEAASFINGQVIRVDGGYSTLK